MSRKYLNYGHIDNRVVLLELTHVPTTNLYTDGTNGYPLAVIHDYVAYGGTTVKFTTTDMTLMVTASKLVLTATFHAEDPILISELRCYLTPDLIYDTSGTIGGIHSFRLVEDQSHTVTAEQLLEVRKNRRVVNTVRRIGN